MRQKNYILYGPGWKASMLKWDKTQLIEFLRKMILRSKMLEEKISERKLKEYDL